MNADMERLARDLGEAVAADRGRSFNTLWPDPGFREQMRVCVRAVLTALREPSEAMLQASEREWDGRMSYRSSGAWQAMIDTLLKEPHNAD